MLQTPIHIAGRRPARVHAFALPLALIADGEHDAMLLLAAACAVAVCYGASLIFREWIARSRRRVWTELLLKSVDQTAEGRESVQISMAAERELNELGRAFNRMARKLAEDKSQTQNHDRALESLSDELGSLHATFGEIAACENLDALRRCLPKTWLALFAARRCRLWLLHSHAAGAPPLPAPEGAEDPLVKTGFILAADEFRSGADRDRARALAFPAAGALEAAMTRRYQMSGDVSASPFFKSGGASLAGEGFGAFLAVPILAHNKVIGVIESFKDHPFAEAQVRIAEIFADHAAHMLASAWSTQEAARVREALEMKTLEMAMTNRKLERSNAKLAEADRLKSEFLANTSHELRTPLNSILGFAQLILSRSYEDEAEMMSYVGTINDSGRRLLNLINDVLDLAKIEAGRMTLELGPVDVRTALDSARTLMAVQAEERGNALVFEVPEGDLPNLRADASKIHQVLVNVLGNANKFTENGKISVRVLPAKIPGFMRFEIADTGVGISPENQRKLFNSFVQADGSTTRKFGGTGLGLAISRKIVASLGGAIALHSAGEGKGTTVTIDLPNWCEELERADTRAADAAGICEDDAEGAIVVVEDYLEFQKYVKELLETRGWKVRTARTAASGLELIRKCKPRAVVLDMHLPGSEEAEIQTGADIIRALGQQNELSSIPILVVTGMHQEACSELLGQTVLMPVELYSKPLNEKAFLEAVDRLTAAA